MRLGINCLCGTERRTFIKRWLWREKFILTSETLFYNNFIEINIERVVERKLSLQFTLDIN